MYHVNYPITCVDNSGTAFVGDDEIPMSECLTVGRQYTLLDVDDEQVLIVDNMGMEALYTAERFEGYQIGE